MKLIKSLLTSCLLLAGTANALPADVQVSAAAGSSIELESGIDFIHDWVAKKSANLCGISNLKKVTHPAVVDYDALLAATPQVKEMKAKGIKPDSVAGKTLRKAARDLIVQKAPTVQKDGGYDGLWKAIEHKDGRSIDDVTQDIIDLF